MAPATSSSRRREVAAPDAIITTVAASTTKVAACSRVDFGRTDQNAESNASPQNAASGTTNQRGARRQSAPAKSTATIASTPSATHGA